MILRPQPIDLRVVAHFLGKIVLSFGATMIFPIGVALLYGEAVPVVDFAIGALACGCAGVALLAWARLPALFDMDWRHGMVVVSLTWLVCMGLGAIPLYLSGHWASFLDACFETMSGLATTGLVLVQDLDHLSRAANLWRHLLMFLGGQGIVIVALSFLIKGGPVAMQLYVGEARDEKILPNVVQTARFIWLVSLVYFVLGAGLLTACGVWGAGLPAGEALFHGVCNFMAAFDTGGFMPQSQNIIYYQSFWYEAGTIVLIVWGGINFNLHYALWMGRRGELGRNIETRVFLTTLTAAAIMVVAGLAKDGVYPGVAGLWRRGFYQAISAHSGTGFQSIYAGQFNSEWGPLPFLAIIFAMGLGVSACSTTGGIKMLRVGVIAKGFREDIKRFLLAGSAVIRTRVRHLSDQFLTDRKVRSAALIALAYVALYLVGAVAGCFFGYPLAQSLFESTSAAANVGLSCGVTQAGMPAALKVVYILQMWAGRLEFISVFVLFGFIVSYLRGK